MRRRRLAGARHHAAGPAVHGLDRGDLLHAQRRAESARIREAGTGERLRVDRTVFRREQGAAAVRGGSRPALPHLVALEPVAAQPGLALAPRALLQPVDRCVVEGE